MIAESYGSVILYGAMGVGGWLVRSAFGRVGDRIKNVEHRQDKHERDIESVREKAVQREEFIREIARTRNTLEKLTEGFARIEGKLEIAFRSGLHAETARQHTEGTDGNG